MATRFYFPATGTPSVSPSFNAGWEQTGEADRITLVPKTQMTTVASASTGNRTVPITTTQDILARQYVSGPIPTQYFTGTVSLVVSPTESAATANVTLAVVIYVVSQDGGTVRGTLFSTFNTDTEFATSALTSTRIVNAQAVTALTTQPGDRIVVELGGHAAGPTAATTYLFLFNSNSATDLALTSAANGGTNNTWIEFSQDIYATVVNNYQFARSVSTGILSVTEKIR